MAGKAGDVVINLTIRSASFSQGLDKAQKQLKQMGGQADSAGGKVLQFQRKMESAGHGSVTTMQATSASLRLAEGGMNNLLRSAERFASTVPGIGAAAKAIFPAVGAIAIGNMFYEGEERVRHLIETINAMPKAINDGFEAMHQSTRLANDELSVTADKLDVATAKLEGRPTNNLALEIDEARVSADKFVTSVERAENEVAKLLEQNRQGFGSFFFLSKAPTVNLEGTVNAYKEQLANIALRRQEALYAGDTKGADQALKDYKDKLQAQANAAAQAVSTAQKPAKNPYLPSWLDFMQPKHSTLDQSGNLAIARRFREQSLDALTGEADREREEASRKANEKAQAAKDKAEAAKRAAEAFHQAQEKAAHDQMATFDRGYAELEKAGNANIFQTRAYWEKMLQATQKGSADYNRLAGSLNYDRVNQKLAESTKAMDEQLEKSLHRKRDTGEDTFLREQERAADESARRVAEIQQRGLEVQRRLDERGQLVDVNVAVSHGEISRYQALVAEAQIHAAAFGAEIADVQQRLDEAQALSALPGMKEEAAKLAAQLAQLKAQAAQQIREDQSAIYSQTPSGALSDAFHQWSQQATDAAEQVRRAFEQAANGINDSLAKALTDPARTGYERMQNLKQGLSGTFRGLANQGIEFSLAKVETLLPGGLGKIFGGGKKPTGAKGDPLYVAFDQAAGKAGAAASVTQAVTGGATTGGGFMGLLGSLFGIGGGAAPAVAAATAPAGGGIDLGPLAPILAGIALPSVVGPSGVGPASTNTGAAPAGTSTGAAGSGLLGGLLGGLPSIFGIGGKPDGTPGNPLSVTGGAATGGGAGGGLMSGLNGLLGFGGILKMGGLASVAAGGQMDPLGGLLTGILPGFADGGPIAPDMGAFIVGEHGKEILNIGSASGHVTPNNKLRSYSGGGGGDIHFHPGSIDARGATDPAAVEAAVYRAIGKVAPSIARMGMQGSREDKLRRPTTAH